MTGAISLKECEREYRCSLRPAGKTVLFDARMVDVSHVLRVHLVLRDLLCVRNVPQVRLRPIRLRVVAFVRLGSFQASGNRALPV